MLASPQFDQCCRDFESYPSSLIEQNLDIYSAKLCRQTIAQSTPRLLVANESYTNVRFRDFHARNGIFEKKEKRLHLDLDIGEWLGDSTQSFNLGALPRGKVASYRDPQCRIIYLTAPNNRSALQITKKSLTRILTFHQVMPAYFDLVSNLFGYSERPVNLTYFAFRDRTFLDGADPGLCMPALGRSGRHFQLAYVLKKVASTSEPNQPVAEQEWSIRPAAFYHHFDIETGAAFWLTSHGRPDLYERMAEATASNTMSGEFSVQDDFRRALRIHLIYASWASEGWCGHIQWFEGKVRNETHLAVYGSSNDLYDESLCNTEQLARIQILEEKLNEAIIVLEGNIKIIGALRSFYAELMQNESFVDQVARRNDHMLFNKELGRIESDLESVLTRARYQSKLTADRKNLVLLQLQDRNLAKMETIALDTRRVSIESQHEAVIMRIFTAVTLVYLPATFVSTVFSTDVIKYQGGVSFSLDAMLAWLQVTLPLTFVTLLVAGVFYYRSYKTAQKNINFVPISEIRRPVLGERLSQRTTEKGS